MTKISKLARSHLKDDMTFLAPIASHNSADAYLEGNETLRSKYGIKKVLYEVKRSLWMVTMSAFSLISI